MFPQLKTAKLVSQMETAFDFAQSQVDQFIQQHPDYFPMYTANGKWAHAGETWTNWCEGFWGGMMWLFYQRTGDIQWRARAEHYSGLIEGRQYDRKVHDLGFLFWSTYKRWYDIDPEGTLNKVIITAGQTMGLRYQNKGAYLCSFVAPDSIFIDIMMNVGIVFYAAKETGDTDLLEKAHNHCYTTRRHLVRGDGSTAHEGIFDLDSGQFLRQTTHQGWRGDSTWARGQAWALYGFCTAFLLTGNQDYLNTARMCADYYLEKTSFRADAPFGAGVPPNDWEQPGAPAESSAAAIAASGLLQISQIVQDRLYAQQYLSAALTILDTLCSSQYLAIHTPGWQGVLKHGIYHSTKNTGIDESVIWGDYFFVEALDQALTLIKVS